MAALLHIAHWQVAGETLSPLEPSEAMQTLELGYVNAGFLLFALAIVATLLLGRFFCGWACHLVAYQDLCAALLARIGLRPRAVRSRVLVLVPLGAALYMFVWPLVARWWSGAPAPPLVLHLTTDAFWSTFPGPWIAALTFLVDGFLIVYWLGGKAFCAYGCPYGAVFGIAERFAPGRIRVDDRCETCGHCTAVCTSNVRVHEEVARFSMVVDPSCMRCMDCVDVCPKGALSFGFGAPSLRRARAAAGRRRADFSIAEEVALTLVFLGSLYALRRAYSVVPLLLALGLAVLVAVFVVIGWRLLRRRDLQLQGRVLKEDGQLTGAGQRVALGVVLAVAAVLHTGVVQLQVDRGNGHAQRAMLAAAGSRERAVGLAHARAALQRAHSWGVVADPAVLHALGLVAREQGDLDAAEEFLRAALAHRPDWPSAVVPLTDLLALRGAWPEAEERLRAVLRAEPDCQPARTRLELLQRRQETGR